MDNTLNEIWGTAQFFLYEQLLILHMKSQFDILTWFDFDSTVLVVEFLSIEVVIFSQMGQCCSANENNCRSMLRPRDYYKNKTGLGDSRNKLEYKFLINILSMYLPVVS